MPPLGPTSEYLLLILSATLLILYRQQRQRVRELLGKERGLPIPTVKLSEFHEAFAVDALGPTTSSEVYFIGKGDGAAGGTSDTEAWILATLAKRSSRMFEFGTCTGKTAYLWARNSSPFARVVTLTLSPDQMSLYRATFHDSRRAAVKAKKESAFSVFRYSGTDVEHKITQLFGDSKSFDESPYLGQCDLVFVDGSHAYSYVKSDTEKAFRLLKEGGIILWHDYRGPRGDTRDVYRMLNELVKTVRLVNLRGTSLVAFRS